MVLLFAMCCCKYITCTLDAVQCVVARGLWNVVVTGESNSMVASVLILYKYFVTLRHTVSVR